MTVAATERQLIPILDEATLGDRARLLALFDNAAEMPLVRVEIFERDYPCAPEVLRAWAHANRVDLLTIGGGLRLRIAGRLVISVYLAGGAS